MCGLTSHIKTQSLDLLSAIASNSLVVVKSADNTTFVFFSSAIAKSFLTSRFAWPFARWL